MAERDGLQLSSAAAARKVEVASGDVAAKKRALPGDTSWAWDWKARVGNHAFELLLSGSAGTRPSVVPQSPVGGSGLPTIDPQEIARVSLRLRAAERMRHTPTFKQSEGEIDETTGKAAQIAYDYRMLVWHYKTLVKNPWSLQEPAAAAALTAEDVARSRVLIDEETLEHVLSEKALRDPDAYQQDKLRALYGWLTQLESALESLAAAL